MTKYFSIIAAATKKNGIAYKGNLPWKSIPRDWKHYLDIINWNTTTVYANPFTYLYQSGIPCALKETTVKDKRNAFIMGRVTWEVLAPSEISVMKSHLIVILTREKSIPNMSTADSLVRALEIVDQDPSINEVFVLGGEKVYGEGVKLKDRCKAIYLTRIWKDLPCDRFFPDIPPEHFSLVHISKTYSSPDADGSPIPLDFTFYVNKKLAMEGYNCIDYSIISRYPRNEEMQYLELVKRVIETGNAKSDRTGTGTKSLFGNMMKFDLTESFPLLTTKDMFWKGVVEELLWFIRGSTDAKELSKMGVRIWEGNSSREYLDKIGLKDHEMGDLGPLYGFQWRHFGATYKTTYDDYSGQGVDQLADILKKIKDEPEDRRIIICAWNPSDTKKMALPPCHVLAQFYIVGDRLDCMMYQRSCDMGLGVPFNIASYSLLTCILAKATGRKPGEFTHVLGDTHVYNNHVEPLKEQLKRYPYPFPVLNIKKDLSDMKSLEKLILEDFELIEYNSHPKITMSLSC